MSAMAETETLNGSEVETWHFSDGKKVEKKVVKCWKCWKCEL